MVNYINDISIFPFFFYFGVLTYFCSIKYLNFLNFFFLQFTIISSFDPILGLFLSDRCRDPQFLKMVNYINDISTFPFFFYFGISTYFCSIKYLNFGVSTLFLFN